MTDLTPATRPTMYFIGVSTGQSSIMDIFPRWMAAIGRTDAVLKGIDLPLHAPAADYRQVTEFIKADPLSIGALVTTHKLDLYSACAHLFDEVGTDARRLGEVSAIYKRGGRLCADAMDPVSSGLALARFVPGGFWRQHGGQVLLLGAGGSSLAMSLHLTQRGFGDDVPGKIILANRSRPRLDSARRILQGLNPRVEFEFVCRPQPAGNDALVAALPPCSLIVNATGLGKDAPGSPTTDGVDYPARSLVWEINYRGDLLFMRQALAQAQKKQLHVEDGWVYFIHGWTQVLYRVFALEADAALFTTLSDIAMAAMPQAAGRVS